MNKKLLTALIYDERDAVFFLRTKPHVDQILPITPNAQAILLKGGIPFINTTEIYTDYRQARVLARVRRIERSFLSELENEIHLGPAAKETLRGIVHILCSMSASFWELIKELGHCLLPDGKQWVRLVNPKDIHQFLLENLQPQIQKSMIHPIGAPVFPLILKIINGLACSLWESRSLVCFSDYGYGLKKLHYHKNFDVYSLHLRSADGGWKDFVLTMKFLLDTLINKKTSSMIMIPRYLEQTAMAVRRVLSTINDPISWMGIKVIYDPLIETVTLFEGSIEDINKTIGILKPNHIIAGQLRWGTPTVLAQVAREYNIPVTLISHGSHTVPDSSIAEFEHQENAQGLLDSPLSDRTLMQSPHAEAYALKLKCIKGHRSRPIQWGTSKKIIRV